MINVVNGATLSIGSLTLNGQKTGTLISSEGTLNINSGAVIQNSKCSAISVSGGKLTVDEGTTFTTNRVDGSSDVKGGAISATGGEVEINGGSFTTNAAGMGGALYVGGSAQVTINDGEFSGNGNMYGAGGAIYVDGGSLDIAGGTIEGCYSREGGAIINVNKPNNENDGSYSEDGYPTVTISGGTIQNNASQMKGSAIQTIYGGATTTIAGGTIQNNVSMSNMGSLSVEEGGKLTVSGGSVSVGENNENAIYIYNQYSKEDVSGAAEGETPYIEGENAAQLVVSGTPAINGNIHLDDPCKVADKDKTFAPVIDANGYAGNALNVSVESTRPWGEIAKRDLADFNISGLPEQGEAGESNFLYEVTEADGSKGIYYGGYDVEVTVNEQGGVTVTGSAALPAGEKLVVTIGGKDYVISVGENGQLGEDGSGSFTIPASDLLYHNDAVTDGAISASVSVAGADDKKDNISELPALKVADAVSGEFGGTGLTKDPEGAEDNYTLTFDGVAGLEYGLLDKNGDPVAWATAGEDGKVSFPNLKAESEDYTLVVREPAQSGTLPGPYTEIGNLTAQLAKEDAKKAVQEHYEDILAKADENGIDGVGKTELKEALDKALAAIDAAEDSAAVENAKNDGILSLDKTEGKAILDSVLNNTYPGASEEIETIVDDAKAKINRIVLGGTTDNDAAGAAIDTYVKDMLLDMAKQNAKEKIEAAAGDAATSNDTIADIIKEYLGEDGTIGGLIGDNTTPAEVEEDLAAALKAINEAYSYTEGLVDPAADKFKEDHSDILNKETNIVMGNDLPAIKDALDDYNALPDSVKDALTAEKADLDNKLLESLRDAAKNEYKEACEAVGVKPDAGMLEDLDNATFEGANNVYDVLHGAVEDLIEGLIDREKDSDEIVAVADKYEALLDREFVSAEGTVTIPDIAGAADQVVEKAKAEIDALRADEKQAAKDALKEKYDEVAEGILSALDELELDKAYNDALAAIDGAETSEGVTNAKEEGIVALDKIGASSMLEIASGELIGSVTDAEAADAIKSVCEEALGKIEDVTLVEGGFVDSDAACEEIDKIVQDAMLEMVKQYAKDMIEAAAGEDPIKAVQDIVEEYLGNESGVIGGLIGNADDWEEVYDLIAEALEKIESALEEAAEAEDFRKEHADILEKPVEEVTADDLTKIEEALSGYEQLPDAAKDALGEEVKAELEEKKDAAIRDSFVNEYLEACEAVGVEPDESVLEALENAALDADAENNIYDVLKDAAEELLNGFAGENASEEVKAIVEEYVTKIGAAIDAAEQSGTVPDIAGDDTDASRTLVEQTVDKIEAQKALEEAKAQATAEVDAVAKKVNDLIASAGDSDGALSGKVDKIVKEFNDALAGITVDASDALDAVEQAAQDAIGKLNGLYSENDSLTNKVVEDMVGRLESVLDPEGAARLPPIRSGKSSTITTRFPMM